MGQDILYVELGVCEVGVLSINVVQLDCLNLWGAGLWRELKDSCGIIGDESNMSLLKHLQNPTLYNHPVKEFTVVETHISWVLLTGDYAYKIKKPVNFGFLDFSTLERRQHYCNEELRLNRRLAPSLYLEVITIHGTIEKPALNGTGPIIEYAVKMKQFPQSAQCDRILEEKGLNVHAIERLAEKVARFHLAIDSTKDSSDFGDIEHIRQPILENFTQIRKNLDKSKLSFVLGVLEEWTKKNLTVLESTIKYRKKEGYVRECHGDMHLRNIAIWND